MTQKERAKLKKKCDLLWSKVTKIEWRKHHGNVCAWCKIRPGEQSDHIANRWCHSTRWVVENMVLLCMPCHIFRKKRETAEWALMVIGYLGIDRYEAILEASKEVVQNQDYQKVYEYLKSFLPEEPKIVGGKA